MLNQKKTYNFLPAFIVGLIESIIVVLAIFCFLLARGIEQQQIFIYTIITTLFIALLLCLGAYYTRKEELENSNGRSRILNIYKALDIDETLKQEMTSDTLEENKIWEKEWQEGDNATISLSPKTYAASVFIGFLVGGAFILLNNYLMELPDYKALLFPLLALGFLGFLKFKISNKNPFSGMLLIALSGIVAALGAYYAGGLFN